MRLAPNPILVDGERTALRIAPPRLGQHTTEVLHELGCDEATIARYYGARHRALGAAPLWLWRHRANGQDDTYHADMAGADWSALDLGEAVDDWSDDGFVSVEAELRSGPETVPSFLFERRIIHGVCDQGRRDR